MIILVYTNDMFTEKFGSIVIIGLLALFAKGYISDSRNDAESLLFGQDSDESEEETRDFSFCNISNGSYFSNLLTNFGNNQTESTCGYVALAMLLRYYDIYVNDNIVDDAYEVSGSNNESDGTLHEPDMNLPTQPDNVPAYYNYIRHYRDSSLHSYLILSDKDALYFNPPNNYMDGTYRGEFGTNIYTLSSLAYEYLADLDIESYCTIVTNKANGTTITNDDIYSEIQSEILANRPVICGFQSHAYIAYGYSLGLSHHLHTHKGYQSDSDHPNQESYPLFIPSLTPSSSMYVGYLSLHFSFN